MRECWIRATKYGAILFPRSMKAGRKRRQGMIIECVGPRCCRPGTSRSASGIMETRNNRGTFTPTFKILDVALPDKYPKAKCPTAYVSLLLLLFGYVQYSLRYLCFVFILHMSNSSSLYASTRIEYIGRASCFPSSCLPSTLFY